MKRIAEECNKKNCPLFFNYLKISFQLLQLSVYFNFTGELMTVTGISEGHPESKFPVSEQNKKHNLN